MMTRGAQCCFAGFQTVSSRFEVHVMCGGGVVVYCRTGSFAGTESKLAARVDSMAHLHLPGKWLGQALNAERPGSSQEGRQRRAGLW